MSSPGASKGWGEEASSVSAAEATVYQTEITERLAALVGAEGVEILMEYVWHMAVNQTLDDKYVKTELLEFLGTKTAEFVEWLFERVVPTVRAKPEPSPAESHQSSRRGSGTRRRREDRRRILDIAVKQANRTDSGDVEMKSPAPREPREPRQVFVADRRQRDRRREGPFEPRSQRGTPPIESVGRAVTASDPPKQLQYAHPPPPALPSAPIFKVKRKCANFPNCAFGDHCRFIHPAQMCTNWPRCPFGFQCFFIHPDIPCKFGPSCFDCYCNYSHPPSWNPPAPFGSLEPASSPALEQSMVYQNKTLTTTDGDFAAGVSSLSISMPATPPSLRMQRPPPTDEIALPPSSGTAAGVLAL